MNSNHKNNQPLVSVIIPFYNDITYLNEALVSCIENTYPNIEVLIVDDCSDKPLRSEDLKMDTTKRLVTILRNKENRGPGYSRNVGIQSANGEYIAFLDADDIWFKEIVGKLIDVFLSDLKAVWVYTDGYYLVDNKRKRRPNSYYHGFQKNGFPVGDEVNKFHLRGYNYMTFSSCMFKKKVLLEVGLFNDALEVSEDWDLFVRVAEKYPVHAINEPLMCYRVNNSGRHFINREGYIRVNTKILKDMYIRQGLLPLKEKEFNLAVAMIYERAGIQRLNAGMNKEAREFLFHPKCAPLANRFRTICLRTLSLLPSRFYQIALWVYDHI